MNADITPADYAYVEICLTSSKGLGLFAKQDIKRGTRILSEVPLMVLPANWRAEDLQQKLSKLSRSKLDQFHGLQSKKDLLDPRSRK